MKLSAFITALLLFSLPGMHIQAQSAFFVGGHYHFNSRWILNQNNYGLSELDYELKFGHSGGLALGGEFTDRWGFQLEFNFCQLGQDYRDNIGLQIITNMNTVFDVRKFVEFSYFQIPLMIKYQSDTDPVKFTALLGPQLGVLTSADMIYSADGDTIPLTTFPNIAYPGLVAPQDYFKSLDMGIAGEVGADIYLGTSFFIRPSFRFYFGISDINSDETRNALDYEASRNAYFGLGLGLFYRIASDRYRYY